MNKNFFFYLFPPLIEGLTAIFFVVPFTTFYLEPVDFGVYAVVMVIIAWISALCSNGRAWVLSAHYYKVDVEERKKLFFNIIFLSVVTGILLFVVFKLIPEQWLNHVVKDYKPQYHQFFILAFCTMILNEIWPTISYVMVLKKMGKAHAKLEVSKYFVGVGVTVICLKFLKLRTITLFLSPLISVTFICLVGLWYMRKDILPKISFKWLREIFFLGMPTVPCNLCEIVASNAGQFFIQKWLNLHELGIYAHSKSYQQFFTMGYKAFSRTSIPDILEGFIHKRNQEKMHKVFSFWYGLLGIGGVLIILFSYDIISFLTHGKFSKAGYLVPIWYMLVFLYTLGTPYMQFLLVHKKNVFLTFTGIGVSLFSIALSGILIFKFGMVGAAVSILVVNIAAPVLYKIYAGSLGCKGFAESKMILVVGVLSVLYFLNFAFSFNLVMKTVLAICFALAIVVFTDFLEIIKNWKEYIKL